MGPGHPEVVSLARYTNASCRRLPDIKRPPPFCGCSGGCPPPYLQYFLVRSLTPSIDYRLLLATIRFCKVVFGKIKYMSIGNDHTIFKWSGLEQTIVTGGILIDIEKAAVCKSTPQTFKLIKIFKVQPRLMHLLASSPCIRRVTRRYNISPGYMMSNERTGNLG